MVPSAQEIYHLLFVKSESGRTFHTKGVYAKLLRESLFRSLHSILGYILNLFSVYIKLQ